MHTYVNIYYPGGWLLNVMPLIGPKVNKSRNISGHERDQLESSFRKRNLLKNRLTLTSTTVIMTTDVKRRTKEVT